MQPRKNWGQAGTAIRGSSGSGSNLHRSGWCQQSSCPLLSRWARMPARAASPPRAIARGSVRSSRRPSRVLSPAAPTSLDRRRAQMYITIRLCNHLAMHDRTRERLDATFAALADPTRRAILARLAAGEASVTELAAPFDISQPAISKHLKVLERAGLISRGRDAQRRPRRLEPRPLAEATGWLETYRRYWEGNFGRLDAVLEELKAQKRHGRSRR